MGGSALPGNAVRFLDAAADVSVHRDYDLPEGDAASALHVAISYSGNTEETLSFAEAALRENRRLAVVASGGALLALAEKNDLPFVQVPDGLQPRDALLYLLPALLALMGRDDLCAAIAAVSIAPQPVLSESGTLAAALAGGLPLFYASRRNGFLAYVSKIHANETAKMPAYANVFPELNHNEMQSFDTHAPEVSAAPARFVVLHDEADDPRVARRMRLFSELMEERGRTVIPLTLSNESRATALVRHWYVMHLAARELARSRGVDPDNIALIEDFKRRLAA
jgi:glucose/mannose-6-phosphate isomerase